MIRTYRLDADRCRLDEAPPALVPETAWIDLVEPTVDEERAVERFVGVQIPTREEMAEIELSSRIYMAGGAAVMTVPLVMRSGGYPGSTDVTFVLTPRHLVTVRYAEPTSIRAFAAQVARFPEVCTGADATFAGLMDAIADRLADVLEEIGRELDATSRAVFTEDHVDLRAGMRVLGRAGDAVALVRQSLLGLSRVIDFARKIDHVRHSEADERLKTVGHDVTLLLEHVDFLSNKITFLLDAMLGLVNVEQNQIIKIFSVVAVVFLPPTLIASIYGMNFDQIPELKWHFGYFYALGAMVVSMIIPYVFFKRKGWI